MVLIGGWAWGKNNLRFSTALNAQLRLGISLSCDKREGKNLVNADFIIKFMIKPIHACCICTTM